MKITKMLRLSSSNIDAKIGRKVGSLVIWYRNEYCLVGLDVISNNQVNV